MRLKAAAGCAPLPLGCAELGPLSCGARRRGSGCSEHICRPPHPHNHPEDPLAPAPPAGSARMVPASGRSRAPPGTARGQPRSWARPGSAPVQHCNRHLYLARHGLGFSWTDKIKQRRRGGRGEKQNSSTDVGCHGRRYTGIAGSSRCVYRPDEAREVAAAAPSRHVGKGRHRCLRSRRRVPGRSRLQALEEEGIARSPPGAVAELPDAGPLPHGALLPGIALRAAAGGEGDPGGGRPVPSRRVPPRRGTHHGHLPELLLVERDPLALQLLQHLLQRLNLPRDPNIPRQAAPSQAAPPTPAPARRPTSSFSREAPPPPGSPRSRARRGRVGPCPRAPSSSAAATAQSASARQLSMVLPPRRRRAAL